jgi:hypothetical protein
MNKSSSENQSSCGVSRDQLLKGREEGVESLVAGYWPYSNDVGAEAGGSSLLKFVTRKRLVKLLQRKSHCWEPLPSNC